MPGINYTLGLQTERFKKGSEESLALIKRIHTGMDALKGAGAGAGAALGGLSKMLFQLPQQALAVKGILQTLSLPITLAASAETTATAFKVMIGDADKARKTLDQIRDLAAETPFEFPELAGAARKLIAFGESSQTVAATLRRVGDISSGIQAPIGEIAELYGKARVQGTLFAEDINQLMGRGIPIMQEFAKQLGKSNGEIKTMASEGKITFDNLEQAFINLTSGSGQFRDMMEQTSTTMEGRLSSLSDAFTSVMSAVGEGLNEALKPLVSGATEKIESLKEKAKELGKELGTALDFGVVALQTGKVGEVLLAAFKAGGLAVADQLAKAMDWGAKMISATILLSLPGPAAVKAKLRDDKDRLSSEGLGFKSAAGVPLGSKSLTEKSEAATAALKATADDLMTGVKERQGQRVEEAAAHDNAMKLRSQANEAGAAYLKSQKDATDKEAAGRGKDLEGMFQPLNLTKAELVPLNGAGKAKMGPASNNDADAGDGDVASRVAQASRSNDGAAAPPRRTIKGAGYGKKDAPREGLAGLSRMPGLAAAQAFRDGLSPTQKAFLPKPLSPAAIARSAAPSPARQRREERANAAAATNQSSAAGNAQFQLLKQMQRDLATLTKNSSDQSGL